MRPLVPGGAESVRRAVVRRAVVWRRRWGVAGRWPSSTGDGTGPRRAHGRRTATAPRDGLAALAGGTEAEAGVLGIGSGRS
ncbi:hypothetical protein ACWDGI_17185 [Streptomyces sp. NPDC001220]